MIPLIECLEKGIERRDNFQEIIQIIKENYLFQKNEKGNFNFEINFKIAKNEGPGDSDLEAIIYIYGLLSYFDFLGKEIVYNIKIINLK